MSNSKASKAKLGDHVRIEYSGQFKDEKAGLQRLGREVFEFTIGSNEDVRTDRSSGDLRQHRD